MSRPPERIDGVRLALRLVTEDDAQYVFSLRNDPVYNAHLSPVSGTVADQRSWLEAYKQREAAGLEAYYAIERRADKVPCGLVRLYAIEKDRFTWGSWVLDAGKPAKAALESAVLSFGVGFETLGKTEALIDVRRDNLRALSFYRRFGMTQTHADERDVFFSYRRERFEADKAAHWAAFEGQDAG